MPARASKILLLGIAVLALAAWGHSCVWAAPPDFAEIKRKVRAKFSGVPQMTTAELAAWLADARRPPPVLLDTRTEAEFAVSHLRGAIRVEPSAKARDLLPLLPPGRAVVTYCSVGYRSSAVAERLQKAGVAQVANLEGSIFQWANEGRPLEARGHAAQLVHPYDERWGRLLDARRRAPP